MIVFDCADQKRMSGGVFALVVMILAVSFIHGSYALKCYLCESYLGQFCDDPLDKNNSQVYDNSPALPSTKAAAPEEARLGVQVRTVSS